MVLSESERREHTEDVIEHVGRLWIAIVCTFCVLFLVLHFFGVIDLEQWHFPMR
jgi:hypothetical protein